MRSIPNNLSHPTITQAPARRGFISAGDRVSVYIKVAEAETTTLIRQILHDVLDGQDTVTNTADTMATVVTTAGKTVPIFEVTEALKRAANARRLLDGDLSWYVRAEYGGPVVFEENI